MEQSLIPIAESSVAVPFGDDDAVERLVPKLREACRMAPLQLAVQVGKLVVEDLYDGDVSSWRHRGEKDTSLRKLCEHPDLPANLNASVLYRALGIYEMSTRQDIWRWKNLEYCHFRAVLSVEAGHQRALLEKANEKRWSVAELLSEVAGIRRLDPGKRGGRPALPRFVKSLNRLEKLLAEPEELLGDLDQVGTMDVTQIRELRKRVSNLQGRLTEIQEALGGEADESGA